MELADILAKGSVIACAKVASKRQLLQLLADKAVDLVGVESHQIFETLVSREQLGSTGLGNGIAIPHGKLEGIAGVTAVFARLDQPIDFDSVDDQPVDLVIMLLAPAGSGADHLKALARVARLMRTDNVTEQLRNTRDTGKLYEILTAPIEATNAA
ncbi:PTS IIA-like nitrogen regulatory protein PtsN [Mariluticola halotolerans]|uniref:PTS IIA-like nitrogen regulatory protein PtsN n=1 Tax=Mariluticola halotolerans TaxID=2909283 RepID=UPI0026E16B3E|nr:PTS IIA-like nitrogen regulatory protein PtsN [Mariluticola halotolerans]UJQ93299.1 PTS IIA-like nitrogen regulatory protein PtsN [Mariluticola halotolerans]